MSDNRKYYEQIKQATVIKGGCNTGRAFNEAEYAAWLAKFKGGSDAEQ